MKRERKKQCCIYISRSIECPRLNGSVNPDVAAAADLLWLPLATLLMLWLVRLPFCTRLSIFPLPRRLLRTDVFRMPLNLIVVVVCVILCLYKSPVDEGCQRKRTHTRCILHISNFLTFFCSPLPLSLPLPLPLSLSLSFPASHELWFRCHGQPSPPEGMQKKPRHPASSSRLLRHIL